MSGVINDGFGDYASIEEVATSYTPWLHARAYRLLGYGHNDHEDLVQEGLVAMWQALRTHDRSKGSQPAWLTTHANWRMKDVVSKRVWLGMPSRAGRHDLHSEWEPVSLDRLMEEFDGIEHLLHAADLLEAVEWAYHHGEVAQALDALSPQQRKYVWLRFWRDWNKPMLTEEFGYDPTALWSSQKNGARLKLRARLAHLVAA